MKIKHPKKLWPSPSILGRQGKDFWNRIGKQLVSSGTLSELDKESFTALCIAYDTMMQAATVLKKESLVIRGDHGQETRKKHPAYPIFRASMKDFNALAERFGLNPMARGKLKIPTEEGVGDDEQKKFFPNE